MPNTEPPRRLFAVTTPGLSATRWLAYVLASHPDVYVAHGKHALDAVIQGDFRKEKETANNMSLESGNDLWEFYQQHPLEEVFAHYRQVKPEARALGCVHSYTIDALVRSARSAAILNQLRVVNVVRHPVSYIASHFALVRSAEKHPRLYQQYSELVFPQALQEFPELYLMDCPDYRAFLAFAVSCHSVANLIRDLCYPGFRTLQMEVLTTQVETLQSVCEHLTGLSFARESLEEFIHQGAINQHRTQNRGQNPHELFASWEPWQQDMAQVLIPTTVLDRLQGLGYDISMLRLKSSTPTATSATKTTAMVPCLGDRLRVLDQRHPLLDYLTQAKSAKIQAVDTEQQAFSLVEHEGKVYLHSSPLESQDTTPIEPATLVRLAEQGQCQVADSVGDAWLTVADALSTGPQILENGFHGFNLLGHRWKVFAVAQAAGQVDLLRLTPAALQALQAQEQCLESDSLENARQAILEMLAPRLQLIEEGYHGFNLIADRKQIFAVSQALGPVNLDELQGNALKKHCAQGQIFVGTSAAEVKQRIDAAREEKDLAQPVRNSRVLRLPRRVARLLLEMVGAR